VFNFCIKFDNICLKILLLKKITVLSLIIAVYKNIDALNLIFESLQSQSFKNFEVIVAEDNDCPFMRDFISSQKIKFAFPIKHVQQPDKGFRKCAALNAAIKITTFDYLVFIDGDCLLHRYFLRAHFENREKKIALWARRVMLSPLLTNKIYSTHSLSFLNLPNLIIFGASRLDCALYLPALPTPISTASHIWGCNWSIFKEDILNVNGFDEDYIAAGVGEDTDIEWRLLRSGIQLKKIKFQALQYHLHHAENYSSTNTNETLMQQKIKLGAVFCKNGIVKA